MSDWDPQQYNRFADERELPFWDLAALLDPFESARLVDLGCGDGRLTAELHDRFRAKQTIGVERAPAMLAATTANERRGLTFVAQDIENWAGEGFNVIFSNAALHWVPNHVALFERLKAALSPSGQLAIQVPANADHPAYRTAARFAEELLGTKAPPDPVAANVLAPEQYATLLHELGFKRQRVQLHVYGHQLSSSGDVVEWIKGSSLTRFQSCFSDVEYKEFLETYRLRLIKQIGDKSPYLFTFNRLLIWASLS